MQLHSIRGRAALAIAVACASGAAGAAGIPGTPVIQSVVVMDDLKAIAIVGDNVPMRRSEYRVVLGVAGEPGDISRHCKTVQPWGKALVCTLPGGLPPAGDYLLTLENVRLGLGVEYALTIGAVGPRGAQGERGVAGAAGAPGPTGAQGAPGTVGPAGAEGPQGAPGVAGPIGPKGDTGDTGATGAPGQIGQTGPQGAPGNVGAKGDTGDRGPIGPMGPMGPMGPAGSSFPDSRFGTRPFYAARTGQEYDCVLGTVSLTAATVTAGMRADGQLLAINQYQALFALLGTQYGGDGQTTFAVPNLNGTNPNIPGSAPNGLTYWICSQGIFPSQP